MRTLFKKSPTYSYLPVEEAHLIVAVALLVVTLLVILLVVPGMLLIGHIKADIPKPFKFHEHFHVIIPNDNIVILSFSY